MQTKQKSKEDMIESLKFHILNKLWYKVMDKIPPNEYDTGSVFDSMFAINHRRIQKLTDILYEKLYKNDNG